MIQRIGEHAGQVWRFLNEKGAQRLGEIAKGTGLTEHQVDRAIGWLAREGQVQVMLKGKVEVFAITMG